MQEVFENIIEKLEENSFEMGKDSFPAHYVRLNKAIEIVKMVAEEYGTDTNVGSNVWIPCSERLPETNESVLCWAKSTERGGDVCFVGSCHNSFWFLQSSADTHSFPRQYVIIAWQPIDPYQPKGE